MMFTNAETHFPQKTYSFHQQLVAILTENSGYVTRIRHSEAYKYLIRSDYNF